MNLEQIISDKAGTIIDVRTPGEFMGGHVAGSINIPLNEIPGQIEYLKQLESPIIFCCASGNRSGQATQFAGMHGLSCLNGGSWMTVNYLQSLQPTQNS